MFIVYVFNCRMSLRLNRMILPMVLPEISCFTKSHSFMTVAESVNEISNSTIELNTPIAKAIDAAFEIKNPTLVQQIFSVYPSLGNYAEKDFNKKLVALEHRGFTRVELLENLELFFFPDNKLDRRYKDLIERGVSETEINAPMMVNPDKQSLYPEYCRPCRSNCQYLSDTFRVTRAEIFDASAHCFGILKRSAEIGRLLEMLWEAGMTSEALLKRFKKIFIRAKKIENRLIILNSIAEPQLVQKYLKSTAIYQSETYFTASVWRLQGKINRRSIQNPLSEKVKFLSELLEVPDASVYDMLEGSKSSHVMIQLNDDKLKDTVSTLKSLGLSGRDILRNAPFLRYSRNNLTEAVSILKLTAEDVSINILDLKNILFTGERPQRNKVPNFLFCELAGCLDCCGKDLRFVTRGYTQKVFSRYVNEHGYSSVEHIVCVTKKLLHRGFSPASVKYALFIAVHSTDNIEKALVTVSFKFFSNKKIYEMTLKEQIVLLNLVQYHIERHL